MGLMGKLRGAVRGWKSSAPVTMTGADPLVQAITGIFGEQMRGPSLRLTASSAEKHFKRWQYIGATAFADAISQVEYEVQTLRGDTWSHVPGHPLERLLRRPNPFLSARMMWYYMGLDLTFFGTHYWKIVFNRLEEPAELWPLFGEMKVKSDDSSFVTGYELTYQTKSGPRTISYEPDEIIAFRIPMIQSLHGGASAFTASSGSISLDEELLTARWKTFRNGVFPQALLYMQTKDPQIKEELRAQLIDKFAGAQHAGDIIALTMDAMRLEPWSATSPKEMDYAKTAPDVRDEVLAGFRTPAVIAGVTKDVQNRSTAEAAEYVYAKWTVQPRLMMLTDQLNLSLTTPNYGEGVRVYTYPVTPEDRTAELAEVTGLVNAHVLTPNEARERYGYERVPWGDRPIVSIGIGPMSDDPAGDLGAQSAPCSHSGVDVEVLGYDRKSRRAIARLHQGHQGRFAKGYRKAWAGIFGDLQRDFIAEFDRSRGQGLDALAALYSEQGRFGPVDRILAPERLAALFNARSKPYTVRGLILGGQFDGEMVGVAGRSKWGADSPALLRAAVLYDDAYWRGVATTSHRQMTALAGELLDRRATWEEMRAAFIEAFDLWESSRAANIATSETTRLMGAGGQAFREEFELAFKQWVASFVNTRDTHAQADGQVRKNRDLFNVGSDRMMHPGGGTQAEENCNCNCAATAVPQ